MWRDLSILITVISFIIVSYFSYLYSITFPLGYEEQTAKEVFSLEENDDVIFMIKKISWLTLNLRVMYIRDGKINLTETKYFQDADVGNKLAASTDERDILKMIWYIDIVYLIYCIFNKNK